MNINIIFGQNVKLKRKQLGYSQEYVAEKMGYKGKSSIAKIETGKADLPASKAQQLASILETTVPDLMGITDEPISEAAQTVDFNSMSKEQLAQFIQDATAELLKR